MSEDEHLAEGWILSLLSSVISHITDGTHAPPARELSGIPLLSAKDIDKGQITISESRFVPEDYYESEQRRTKLAENDVLVTIVGSIGRSAIVPTEHKFAFQRSVAILKPSAVTAKYLSYYLEAPQAQDFYRAHSRGTAQQGLYLHDLKQLPIPVPPFEVQQQITDFIDAAQAKRRAASEHLAVAQRVIERLRQAVVVLACSGRLTADWREENSDDTVNKLLEDVYHQKESILRRKSSKAAASVDCDFEVPGSWAVTSLDCLSIKITSGSRDWSQFYGNGSGTFVMAQNVRRGYLDWTFRQPVDPPEVDASKERSQIAMGDLLVTIVGANTGDAGPVIEDRPEHYVCQSVALIRPVFADLGPYLSLWFNSVKHGRGYFEDCIYGAGRPHLSFDQLKAAPVAVPPLDEQKEIMQRADQLLRLADSLKYRIALASRQVELTSQAVLAKAFRGEFLPENIEATA